MFPSLSFLYRDSNQTLLKCSYSFSLTDFFFFFAEHDIVTCYDITLF
jgi:hypothetical protein